MFPSLETTMSSLERPAATRLRSSPDSLVEHKGFEPSVPREAAGILVISVLVRADFSACRESSK